MKIDPTGAGRSASSVRRGERGQSTRPGEFARHLDSSASASGVSGTSPLGQIQSILSLQEVDDPTTRRARAVRRGNDILDRLEELRLGLLAGHLSRDTIADLAVQVRAQRMTVEDPQLQSVLDEIELRAEVELAKLDRGTREA